MSQQASFVINGVIDTSKNVLSNIDALCQASGCWITYDVSIGQWAVIINNTGSSVFSFDNSNIIGSITISGTGINDLYNSVTVQYPLQDLAGDIDYANLTIDPSLRFPNENDNNLSLQTNLINNPVQAQFMGQIALKQNRIDKVISLTTDFGAIGLKAGDIVDVTEDMYGYTNKLFRVITIDENDAADGSIQLSITALEYDASVYDASGLTYTNAVSASGIVPVNSNSNIQAQNATQFGNTPTVKAFVTDPIYVVNGDGSYQYDPSVDDETFYNTNPLSFACIQNGVPQTVTLKYSGYYYLKYNCNFGGTKNGSINDYPTHIRKQMRIVLLKNGTLMDLGQQQITTIIKGEDPWADLNCEGKFQANADDVLEFYVGLKSDLQTVNGDKTVCWVDAQLIYTGTTA
jgi:hypothetical protein